MAAVSYSKCAQEVQQLATDMQGRTRAVRGWCGRDLAALGKDSFGPLEARLGFLKL
ncbi:hypothetical protein U1Q18_042616, partial [Sarracenia purpurea var. burkii]